MTPLARSTLSFRVLIKSKFLFSVTCRNSFATSERCRAIVTCLGRPKCSLLPSVLSFDHLISRSISTSPLLLQSFRKQKSRSNSRDTDASSENSEIKETIAFCSADAYNLPMIRYGFSSLLSEFNLPEIDDAIAYNYKTGQSYIFSHGIVVFWNISPSDQLQFINQLSAYAQNPLHRKKVTYVAEDLAEFLETDTLSYIIASDDEKASRINRKGLITLSSTLPSLEQYAFSNALALSVKLATWESSLDSFAESIKFIAQAMREGRRIKIKRTAVFQKVGELFTLRSNLNLESDFLGPPDFYWDREDLETLFQNTCAFLALRSRTNLMNEKLTYCYELLQQLTSHLDQEHNTKLEWMIIILITVEVLFEVIHFLDKYSLS